VDRPRCNRLATGYGTVRHPVRPTLMITPEQGDVPMRMRRTAVAALLAAGIVVPTVATPAAAQPAAHSAAAHSAVAQRAKDKVAGKPGRTRKPVRTPFVAGGTVTTVDVAAGTVTLRVRSGTKDVRKRTVTVTVASTARVLVNGKRSALNAVTAGALVTVIGRRSEGVYTANKVLVSQRSRPVVTPEPTPTTEPTSPDPGEISDDLSA
jgi:hypothetical protein